MGRCATLAITIGALELVCSGLVEVVTIEEALSLPRATVDGNTVVMVATIQSFRGEDTTGREVYDQNSAFAEHLLNVPANRLTDILPGADGKPKPSLVNMLRLWRPIVIADDGAQRAHGAVLFDSRECAAFVHHRVHRDTRADEGAIEHASSRLGGGTESAERRSAGTTLPTRYPQYGSSMHGFRPTPMP
jgi:hypothetical protein